MIVLFAFSAWDYERRDGEKQGWKTLEEGSHFPFSGSYKGAISPVPLCWEVYRAPGSWMSRFTGCAFAAAPAQMTVICCIPEHTYMWPHASCRLTHTSRPYVTMCLWYLWGIKCNEFCILNRVIKPYISSRLFFCFKTKRSILNFRANILCRPFILKCCFSHIRWVFCNLFIELCLFKPCHFFHEQNVLHLLSRSNALLRVLTQRFNASYLELWSMRVPYIHMLLSP